MTGPGPCPCNGPGRTVRLGLATRGPAERAGRPSGPSPCPAGPTVRWAGRRVRPAGPTAHASGRTVDEGGRTVQYPSWGSQGELSTVRLALVASYAAGPTVRPTGPAVYADRPNHMTPPPAACGKPGTSLGKHLLA